ncbi:MAG: DUF4124 domain-containing protein, partial [Deltaproteobacteria bacterium]
MYIKIKQIIVLAAAFAVTAVLGSAARADVYVYKDKSGVLTFTNVPNHAGYRRVLRESRGQVSDGPLTIAYYDDLIQTASVRY